MIRYVDLGGLLSLDILHYLGELAHDLLHFHQQIFIRFATRQDIEFVERLVYRILLLASLLVGQDCTHIDILRQQHMPQFLHLQLQVQVLFFQLQHLHRSGPTFLARVLVVGCRTHAAAFCEVYRVIGCDSCKLQGSPHFGFVLSWSPAISLVGEGFAMGGVVLLRPHTTILVLLLLFFVAFNVLF